jgi:hypothetical protein
MGEAGNEKEIKAMLSTYNYSNAKKTSVEAVIENIYARD